MRQTGGTYALRTDVKAKQGFLSTVVAQKLFPAVTPSLGIHCMLAGRCVAVWWLTTGSQVQDDRRMSHVRTFSPAHLLYSDRPLSSDLFCFVSLPSRLNVRI